MKTCDCGALMTLNRMTVKLQHPVIDMANGKPILEWSKDRKSGARILKQKTLEKTSYGLGTWKCQNGCRKERV